ncbi:hypothetical protein [Lelliottia sp. CFBP8978]|jgi:hypothetical protein|uniref:hypothetical protein n=1 Tax=Lelliottia sp. CFBP8978 TaxID=3096522 RepID=UPI002A6A110C|nr:hypothetical protein [Lelliottia sp. CFBP8978]MDY1035752.1 hypothetical protein [Lelliottia sp. CFBP8978]
MRKSLQVLSGALLIAAIALCFAWPYVTMEFAGSAHYTEQDKREYAFYTPDVLKNMPRVSLHYDFDFVNITGPASLVHAIRYYDAVDSGKINAYLESMGYNKQDNCHIQAVCWRGNDPQEIITISELDSPKALLVSVIYNY